MCKVFTHTKHSAHGLSQGMSHLRKGICTVSLSRGARDTRPIYLTHTTHRAHQWGQDMGQLHRGVRALPASRDTRSIYLTHTNHSSRGTTQVKVRVGQGVSHGMSQGMSHLRTGPRRRRWRGGPGTGARDTRSIYLTIHNTQGATLKSRCEPLAHRFGLLCCEGYILRQCG